jgi:hypothetical protein
MIQITLLLELCSVFTVFTCLFKSCIRLAYDLQAGAFPPTRYATVRLAVHIIVQYQRRGDRGRTVVKVLRYKSEGLWFDPSCCHGNFH